MDKMTYINVVLGFILGYCTWNIIDIIKQHYKITSLEKKIAFVKKQLGEKAKVLHMDKETNPLVVAHRTLVDVLGMPKEKVILSNNNNSLTIAYGYSCCVAIDRPAEGNIAIAIGVDKTTEQTEEERQAELDELTKIVETSGFDRSNFSRALAFLTVTLQRADRDKYSKVTRQIPLDML